MSTPEEHIATSKPKRKYTKRTKVDMPSATSPIVQAGSANALKDALNVPRETFEHNCTVPIRSFIKEALNGDKIKDYEYCQNEAAWVPTIHLYGLRDDPDPINPKHLIKTQTHVKTKFRACCEEHKAKIDANVTVLVSGQELDNLSGEYARQGFGRADKSKTKITWEKFTPPDIASDSEHLEALNAQQV
jgi:hypothetical protein